MRTQKEFVAELGRTDRIFATADYFRLHRFHKEGGRETWDEFKAQSFPQAIVAADDAMREGYRVLIYAVSKSGSATLLAENLWPHYAALTVASPEYRNRLINSLSKWDDK